jgi:hypothetical protein
MEKIIPALDNPGASYQGLSIFFPLRFHYLYFPITRDNNIRIQGKIQFAVSASVSHPVEDNFHGFPSGQMLIVRSDDVPWRFFGMGLF